MNEFHSTIKYQYVVSQIEIEYLDLCISYDRETRRLTTKTHIKPTNTFQFLHYQSHHPYATKQAIILGELLRYKNQCSKVSDFLKLKQSLIEHFMHRGYPFKVIRKSMEKAIAHRPKYTNAETDQKIYPLVIKYDCRRPKLTKALIKHLPELEKDQNTAYMARNRTIVAFSNMKMLGQLITKSALNVDNKKQEVIHIDVPLYLPQLLSKCGQRGCKTCPGLHPKNVFKCTSTKKRIAIKNRVNCNSKNLIYILQCPICKLQYVGQTKGTLQQRMTL